MEVTSLIDVIFGLLAALNVFGQSDIQSRQSPLSPATAPVASPKANELACLLITLSYF
jgi:hypothetical protein